MMEIGTPEILFALTIFGMRVLNYAMSTLRMVSVSRGRRMVSALLAMIEALIFAVVIANIVSDLDNLLNLFAYCAGAAAGSYAGMLLESRLITSFAVVNVVSSATSGESIADALRTAGFGVTVLYGQGRDGIVSTLRVVVNRREVSAVNRTVRDIHPDAFVTVENAGNVQHGWMRVRTPGRDKHLR